MAMTNGRIITFGDIWEVCQNIQSWGTIWSSMAELLSPDHVFDFPVDDPTLDVEEPDIEVEEDQEEEVEEDPTEAIHPRLRVLREIPKTLYGSVMTLDRGLLPGLVMMSLAQQGDLGHRETRDENKRVILDFMSEVMGWGAVEALPSESIDVLAVYGDAKRLEPQGPPDGSQTLPPRRLRRRARKYLIFKRVAEAMGQDRRNLEPTTEGARGARENTGGTGGNARGAGGFEAGNAEGIVAPEGRGCSYKTFLNCKPYSFNGTEGLWD
ncbi:hypothetical protein Tco_1004885 [Tanacetum coccineum]|uniref:Uncharacterized protein n=1 Tax=Tanacetum coccineum TaxID=301880 RepID=A0ABQ5FDL0_9ASTR